MTRLFIADAGPSDVEIYLTADGTREPRPYARYRLVSGAALPDDVLAVHRWRRTTPWMRSDDTPHGHTVATVEPAPVTADPLDVLERDQRAGRIRRVNGTPLGSE